MSLKSFIRSITPAILLNKFRRYKKDKINLQLLKDAEKGQSFSKEQLLNDLSNAGVKTGDAILVHCSMSKIGFLNEGPKTFVDALLECVGQNGHVLMPSSPNPSFQLDYIKTHSTFNLANDKSRMGAISEYFRNLDGVVRSANPVEPVCAFGEKAKWLTEGHLGETTAYSSNSPFARLKEIGGKILYVGVTLDNAGTSLHLLEDAVKDFKFEVYYPEIFPCDIVFSDDHKQKVNIKVHHPEQSKKRKCDELLPMFKKHGVYHEAQIGKAKSLVFDAKKMFDCMLDEYHKNGITMYTP